MSQNVEKEVRKLEEELTKTEMRLDVDALDIIYADDIMVTAPIGICVDKPAVMSEVRQASDKARIERYDKDNLKVRAMVTPQCRVIASLRKRSLRERRSIVSSVLPMSG